MKNAPRRYVHEFLSFRLSDELYSYMSKGIISPRVLNWITSGEILELPPLDGGDSDAYRTLVRDKLKETRSSHVSRCLDFHRPSRLRPSRHQVEVLVQSRQRGEPSELRDLEDHMPIIREWNVREDK